MPDGASQAQFEEAARQSLIGAINLTYADKKETLESRPGTETLATKEEQKIYNDLKGKSLRQVAEWAVKNAPDAAQKYFAKRNVLAAIDIYSPLFYNNRAGSRNPATQITCD
jgi:hypothetical protein